mgnify:CR=1 FL=1
MPKYGSFIFNWMIIYWSSHHYIYSVAIFLNFLFFEYPPIDLEFSKLPPDNNPKNLTKTLQKINNDLTNNLLMRQKLENKKVIEGVQVSIYVDVALGCTFMHIK